MTIVENYRGRLLNTLSLDLWQVARCPKAVKCWNVANTSSIRSISRRLHQVRNERKTHKSIRPIRRATKDDSIPLPYSWRNFLALLPDNKSDLARFLSEHIIVNETPDKVVVAAGGFLDERELQSSETASDLSTLRGTHE